MWPVIKANAYGHGLIAVARALESADAFAVARVDEGLALRNGRHRQGDGASGRGFRSPAARRGGARRFRTRGAYRRTNRAVARGSHGGRRGAPGFARGPAGAGAPAAAGTATGTDAGIGLDMPSFKVWLKLDSGMNRLGFKGAAFGAAHEALSGLSSVQSPVNLFTPSGLRGRARTFHHGGSTRLLCRGDAFSARRTQHCQLRRHAELCRGTCRLGAAGPSPVRRFPRTRARSAQIMACGRR